MLTNFSKSVRLARIKAEQHWAIYYTRQPGQDRLYTPGLGIEMDHVRIWVKVAH